MNWAFTGPVLVALAIATAALTQGGALIDDYFTNLRTWRATAVQAPEGPDTHEIFQRAVAAEIIEWDPSSATVEMRRERADQPQYEDLYLALFRIGEAELIIDAEVRRARAQADYVALRVRRPDCEVPCDEDDDWTLLAGPDDAPEAERRALGAARADGPGMQRPDPRLHARLWREAGVGYGRWQAWHATAPITFVLDDRLVDQVDIIGEVVSIAPGWTVEASWRRSGTQRLTRDITGAPDATGQRVAAMRLSRSRPHAVLQLTVQPAPILPPNPPAGRYKLSDWLELHCGAAGSCRPVWRLSEIQRPYSRPPAEPDADTPVDTPLEPLVETPTDRPPPPFLEDWAEAGWIESRSNAAGNPIGFAATEEAVAAGAVPVLGSFPPRPGSLLALADEISDADPARPTLDPEIQQITHDLLTDIIENAAGRSRAGTLFDPTILSYRFPSDGPHAALVVLDLRADGSPGAIRAAVGRPEPIYGLSDWDMEAASYDPGALIPPGPAAWTGRARHQVPGSAWKMVTALALIDATLDPALSSAQQREIREVIFGLTTDNEDDILGTNALSGQSGLCIPRTLDTLPLGISEETCPAGYFNPPIRDSGRGGPLRNPDAGRYGLERALERSSNIWFAAALLHAERLRLEALGPAVVDSTEIPPRAGDRLGATLARLGLLSVAALDGGRGFGLEVRDAAGVEGLSPDSDLRTLASAAFGQQVQAGPLILAQIAGAIRTGTDIRASLLEPIDRPEPLYPGGPVSDELMAQLLDGMRLVVRSESGTGQRAFSRLDIALRNRAGGKTGTADPGDGSALRNSTFAGWIDMDDEAPAGTPGFAIGCGISILGEHDGDHLRVPPICAYAVAELIRRLDRQGVLSP